MFEEPEVPKIPEPAGEPAPEGTTIPSDDAVAPVQEVPSADVPFVEDSTMKMPLADDSATTTVQPEAQSTEAPPEQVQTGSLLNRVTSSLRRVTNALRGQPESDVVAGQAENEMDWMAEIRQETGAGLPVDLSQQNAADKDEGEKRKSVTGQLLSMLTGMMPGGEEKTEDGEIAESDTSARTGLTGRLGKRRIKADESYINDIRQDLVSGEEEGQSKTGKSGGLVNRITGSLRRATASLGGTKPLGQKSEQDTEESRRSGLNIQPEIADDFLADRLGSAPGEAEPIFEMGPGETIYPQFDDDFDDFETYTDLLEPEMQGDEPISLLESGAIAALGEAEKTEDEPDWMAEIRQAAADEEGGYLPARPKEGEQSSEAEPEHTRRKGVTGQLRSFISGILGAQEEKRRRASDQYVPDDMVTDRLGRSLGEQPLAEEEQDELAGLEMEVRQELAGQESEAVDYLEDYELVIDEDVEFPPGLESRFDQFEMADQAEAADLLEADSADEEDPYAITPEDEDLLWGAGATGLDDEETTPITLQDIWGGQGQSENVEEDLTQQILGQQSQPARQEFSEQEYEEERILPILSDEAHAATFLTGEWVEPVEVPTETMLRSVLENSAGPNEEDEISLEKMRSIALDGYRDEGYSSLERRTEYELSLEEGQEDAGSDASELADDWEEEEELPIVQDMSIKAQLSRSSFLQKVILIEAILVAAVLVIAVPIMLLVMMRGPVERPVTVAPRALPADLPYPTGVSLPGGWYFNLSKSTFVNGQWKPAKSEWLEGTELRRVIALPWNLQTEAVVQTFAGGDRVNLYLSNKDVIRYKITSIERVTVGNVDVLSDLKPSLAIVLYKVVSSQ
jgi:hypothetical protein